MSHSYMYMSPTTSRTNRPVSKRMFERTPTAAARAREFFDIDEIFKNVTSHLTIKEQAELLLLDQRSLRRGMVWLSHRTEVPFRKYMDDPSKVGCPTEEVEQEETEDQYLSKRALRRKQQGTNKLSFLKSPQPSTHVSLVTAFMHIYVYGQWLTSWSNSIATP